MREAKTKKRQPRNQKPFDDESQSKNSKAVEPADVNYRVTFLVRQSFQGNWYEKDSFLIVPEHVAIAYEKRKTLIFEKI